MRPPGLERGQGLAEFALAIPIVLLLLFGLFDVGRAVYAYNSITNAAREGARLAIVNQDSDSVDARVAGQATALEVTSSVAFWKPGPNADVTSNDLCSTVGLGCVALVDVATEWTPLTPIIGSLLGPVTLQAASQFPVEFVCPNPSIQGLESAANCPKQP